MKRIGIVFSGLYLLPGSCFAAKDFFRLSNTEAVILIALVIYCLVLFFNLISSLINLMQKDVKLRKLNFFVVLPFVMLSILSITAFWELAVALIAFSAVQLLIIYFARPNGAAK